MKELFSPEVFIEMGDADISHGFCVFFKEGIVKAPVVGKVGTYHYNITGFESFDAVADELCSFSFFKMDQFNFRMVMPTIIDMGNEVSPNTKRPVWPLRYLE